MSGGVDSSVAAYLLHAQGHTLCGVSMELGIARHRDAEGGGTDALHDAAAVCGRLGIEHHVVDFSDRLRRDVIDDFLQQYTLGRTPNPCVRCNRYLKFAALYEYACSIGFDTIATGHYAAIKRSAHGEAVLCRHPDPVKDQSYFLHAVSRSVLDHVVFPLAGYMKTGVREIAQREGLPVAHKPESQEICFIPDNDYRQFLRNNGVCAAQGSFVDTSGRVLGTHGGVCNYTVGQRKGLGLALGSPMYVVSIDMQSDRVVLGSRDDLLARSLIAVDVNLLVDRLPSQCTAKVRSTQCDLPCEAVLADDTLTVTFGRPLEAITPGQSVVLYDNDVVIGGGIIKSVIN